ncbi:MAG: hypothetical protein C0467_26310 [Planctomycetaceae bacterium]|nr:hypothetical protein [Planctomycetaceae bacterium]
MTQPDQPAGGNPTLTAPTGPPPSANFPFLAPQQQPDEIGRLGTYRVLGVLGAGGMGVVFRGEDPHLKRFVALKVMLPQYAADATAVGRFLREARSQAAVEHDHVAVIHHVGEDRGVPFIAMPLLKGRSLSDALKANPRVPVAEAVRIVREMAEGLACAHARGLVHRDIKPGNVWLEGDRRRVKILDFGLARVATSDAVDPDHMTHTGAVLGTPAYMSPEQAQGEPVDVRSDLFSLGVVLYQMLAGRLPFQAANITGLLLAVVNKTPNPPGTENPEVPPSLDALTMRLLAKNPVDRPATAADVVEELRVAEVALGATEPIRVGLPTPHGRDPWASTANTEADSETATGLRTVSESRGTPATVPRERRRWLKVALVLAFVGLAAVAADGIIVKIKNKDGTETEIKVPDGATVTVTKNDKELGKFGPEAKVATPATASDRKAAEYALSLGGIVRVAGSLQIIKSPSDLPEKQFRLSEVDLHDNSKVGDTGLGAFEGCDEITIIWMNGTAIGDEGLKHFKSCKKLRSIGLSDTKVSDKGLAQFQDCKLFETIWLGNTSVTDAGLASFKGCTNLSYLMLTNTATTDVGLAHFKDSTKLTIVYLNGCSGVTDSGLAQFKECKTLTRLFLTRTGVTRQGIDELKKALPQCKIEWDGGVIEPKAK